MTDLTPDDIRAARAAQPQLRDRDLADQLGIAEAQLVAAHIGQGATAAAAHPDGIMQAAATFGETMALTRNASCVHEKIGVYENYHPGAHAAMVLTDDIDLRIFPSHWRHAFMVEEETDTGLRRSFRVFDAAGDAVHKIFLRDAGAAEAWASAKAQIALPEQETLLQVAQRQPPEAPKSDMRKRDVLRKEWRRLTDTHQFLRLTSKLKMNRLGAYRIAGAPFVRALHPSAVDRMLEAVRDRQIDIMLFVGNRGCIQIHTGPIHRLKTMGPWQNVLDPGFNLHLRGDHIAEVWAVEKPTQRGPALSVEAFDAHGSLIFQIFGLGKEGRDSRPAWREIVEDLPTLTVETAE
ncbi:hemin-degrading factor [Roseobacter sinensis]|uniref:Hemin-degrading factor n=1 Tax=Roseobacter sinensis TaxID=2931391 RepID=A0ABT3BKB6_9RHOB|nr:ChuX/HutX family heme-like substrate-binding protein [Roseobacter sp. WL0113]MCV3274006.1 hemin-degrading factor [Roseobacter sp. WL0113]